MKIHLRPLRRRSRTRAVGAGVVQAFAIASQMSLLSPPGIDEWMRLELEGRPPQPGDRRSRR